MFSADTAAVPQMQSVTAYAINHNSDLIVDDLGNKIQVAFQIPVGIKVDSSIAQQATRMAYPELYTLDRVHVSASNFQGKTIRVNKAVLYLDFMYTPNTPLYTHIVQQITKKRYPEFYETDAGGGTTVEIEVQNPELNAGVGAQTIATTPATSTTTTPGTTPSSGSLTVTTPQSQLVTTGTGTGTGDSTTVVATASNNTWLIVLGLGALFLLMGRKRSSVG